MHPPHKFLCTDKRNEHPFRVTFGNIENNTNSITKNISSFIDLKMSGRHQTFSKQKMREEYVYLYYLVVNKHL